MSLLQRCLGIGYGRAARLIDFMAEDGIVGEYNGSQAREVLVSIEDWESRHNQNADSAPAANLIGEPASAGGAGGATIKTPPSHRLLNHNIHQSRTPAST